ncbi:AP-4 complex subunit epsilon-1-like isoform X1 [Mya arenaria]|uniref:AP-4 complex subunit epsilon-1-like isoform X1 n=2 Tax=Mya arenaria TaxID=6604 RepID=UPI0022E82A51|nr:AP-4 complex subunit epsilon-1-like isoform X1 [Mya arenaria]
MAEKSLKVLSRVLADGLFGNVGGSTQSTTNTVNVLNRGFETFVISIRKARSKHEEGQIVGRELEALKTSLALPKLSMGQMKDYLCRTILCHLLGYDVDFGAIHAVKLAQQGTLLEKRTGYLACCLLLNREHELTLLLINTIQKDLKSSNLLDNMLALSAAGQLVPTEMVPSILPLAISKLQHQRELVRQKAVLCLHHLQLLAPELLAHCQESLERALLDKDPGVMAAALHSLYHNIQTNPSKHLQSGDMLVSVLQQLVARKLAAMFEYHNTPAPWLQIHIIKCLSLLTPLDDQLKFKVSTVLKMILQRTSLKEPIAFAVLYEVIQCILKMKADKPVVDEAAEHVKRFLNSSEPNLKFIGVKLLVSLVGLSPEYAIEYQDMIVTSLDHPDPALQKQMHTVLYGVACLDNVEVVTFRLLQQVDTTSDRFWRADLVAMVTELVHRFPGKRKWEVDTLFTALQYCGETADRAYISRLRTLVHTRYLSKQSEETCQKYLVQKCVVALMSAKSSCPLLQIALWILSELCGMLQHLEEGRTIGLLTGLLHRPGTPYPVLVGAVTCLQSLVTAQIISQDTLATTLQDCLDLDLSLVIKQRLSVIERVCYLKLTLHHYKADCMDTTLTFLDDIVSSHLEAGAMPYTPPHLRHAHKVLCPTGGEALDPGESVYTEDEKEGDSSMTGDRLHTGSTSSTHTDGDRDSGFSQSGVKRVWGKQGRLDTPTRPANLEKQENLIEDVDTSKQDLAKALFGSLQGNKPLEKPVQKIVTGFEDNDSDEEESPYITKATSNPGRWSNMNAVAESKSDVDASLRSDSEHFAQDMYLDKPTEGLFGPGNSLLNEGVRTDGKVSENDASASVDVLPTESNTAGGLIDDNVDMDLNAALSSILDDTGNEATGLLNRNAFEQKTGDAVLFGAEFNLNFDNSLPSSSHNQSFMSTAEHAEEVQSSIYDSD